MVRTTVTPDPLQEREVDLAQLGFGEESFPHGDKMQWEQSSFDGPEGFLVPDGVHPSLSLTVL